jgi:hypothetical protein
MGGEIEIGENDKKENLLCRATQHLTKSQIAFQKSNNLNK